jgi:hypothetical protein
LLFPVFAHSQTLGGNSVFNFLKYPSTTKLAALGGVNVSQSSRDAGLAFHNPALLRPSMHTEMNAVFNDLPAGIRVYHLSMAYYIPRFETSFSGGLNYFNYGKTLETDAAGNEYGWFHPNDWVVQVSAARSYLEKWNYGATLKYVQSNYGSYRSSGVAMDLGIHYHDSARSFSAAALARNIGTQLRSYPGGGREDFPFDLQIGITKKLGGAPFSFSLTAQRVHRFDILYNDTAYNSANGIPNSPDGKFTMDKLFRHFIFSATVHAGDRMEFYAGFNFLRRKELNAGEAGNGMNGFSFGAAVYFGKLHLGYARSYYQRNLALNQFGIGMKLNEYFGLGKFGERIGW